MYDIMLDNNGDLAISETGDVSVVNSVCQAVKIRLLWILNEWRLGPELGFPWFEDVFVKNPNIDNIKQLIDEEVRAVAGVQGAEVVDVDYDLRSRKCRFLCKFIVDGEEYIEEATINA